MCHCHIIKLNDKFADQHALRKPHRKQYNCKSDNLYLIIDIGEDHRAGFIVKKAS